MAKLTAFVGTQAAKTYTELEGCTYYSKALGDVPYYDPDASRCDCSWNTSTRASSPALT